MKILTLISLLKILEANDSDAEVVLDISGEYQEQRINYTASASGISYMDGVVRITGEE